MLTKQRFLKRNYLLSAAMLMSGYLVAGDCGIVTKTKTETTAEEKLDKLFAKLPCDIGVYIISFAVRPLHRVTTFEEFEFKRYRYISWVPIETELVPASKSTLGEYTWLSEISWERRKRETKPHESVTKRLIAKQFYQALAAPAKS